MAAAEANAASNAQSIAEREFAVSRQIDATPAEVWRAWTEPEQVKRWFGPHCFDVVACTQDLRPGGKWKMTFRGHDDTEFKGQQFDHELTYRDIVPQRRLVLAEAWAEVEFLVTAEMVAKDGGTAVTSRATFTSTAGRDAAVKQGAKAGMVASLDKLERLFHPKAGPLELVIRRHLDAPPAKVFAAWTEPAQIKQWWGPFGWTTTVVEIDLRPGGRLHMRMRDASGTEYPMDGTIAAVDAPHSLVMTSPFGSGPATCRITFEPAGEGTRLTARWTHASEADRAAHAQTGFDRGWDETLKRLQAYLLGDGMMRSLKLERLLDAPRELVWRAFTEAAVLARWWGPRGFTNPECRIDPKPGGRLWIMMRGPDGIHYPLAGEVREAQAPERLVFAATPEDEQGRALLHQVTTVTLVTEGQQTKLTLEAHAVGLRPVARDMLQGMAPGWNQSLDRLAEEVIR